MISSKQRLANARETEIFCLLGDLRSFHGRLLRQDSNPSQRIQLQSQIGVWHSSLADDNRDSVNTVEVHDPFSLDIKTILQQALVSDVDFLDHSCLCWDTKKTPGALKLLKRSSLFGEIVANSCKPAERLFLEHTSIAWSSSKPLDFRFCASRVCTAGCTISLMMSISHGECFSEQPTNFDSVKSLRWFQERTCFTLAQLLVGLLELRIWRCYKKRKKLSSYLTSSFSNTESCKIESVLNDIFFNCDSNLLKFEQVVYAKCANILLSLTRKDDSTVPLYLTIMKKRLANWRIYCTLPTSESSCRNLWVLHFFSSIMGDMRPPSSPWPSSRSCPGHLSPTATTKCEIFQRLMLIPLLDSFSLMHEFRLLLRDGLITEHHTADLLRQQSTSSSIASSNSLSALSKKKKSRKKRNKNAPRYFSATDGLVSIKELGHQSDESDGDDNAIAAKKSDDDKCIVSAQFSEALSPRDVSPRLVLSTQAMVIAAHIIEIIMDKVLNVVGDIAIIYECEGSSDQPMTGGISEEENSWPSGELKGWQQTFSSPEVVTVSRTRPVSPSDNGFYDSLALYSLPSWVHAGDDLHGQSTSSTSSSGSSSSAMHHAFLNGNYATERSSISSDYQNGSVSCKGTPHQLPPLHPYDWDVAAADASRSRSRFHPFQHSEVSPIGSVKFSTEIDKDTPENIDIFHPERSLFMDSDDEAGYNGSVGGIMFRRNRQTESDSDVPTSDINFTSEVHDGYKTPRSDENSDGCVRREMESHHIDTSSSGGGRSGGRSAPTRVDNVNPTAAWRLARPASLSFSHQTEPVTSIPFTGALAKERGKSLSPKHIKTGTAVRFTKNAKRTTPLIPKILSPPVSTLTPEISDVPPDATLVIAMDEAGDIFASPRVESFPSLQTPENAKPHIHISAQDDLFSKGNIFLVFALTCAHMKSQADGAVLRNVIALQRSLIAIHPNPYMAGVGPPSHQHQHSSMSHLQSARLSRGGSIRHDIEVMSDDGIHNFPPRRGGRTASLTTGAATVSSLVFNNLSNNGSEFGALARSTSMRSDPNSPLFAPSQPSPLSENLDLYPPLPAVYPQSYIHSPPAPSIPPLPPLPQQQYAHDDEEVSYSNRFVNSSQNMLRVSAPNQQQTRSSGRKMAAERGDNGLKMNVYRPRSASASRKPAASSRPSTPLSASTSSNNLQQLFVQGTMKQRDEKENSEVVREAIDVRLASGTDYSASRTNLQRPNTTSSDDYNFPDISSQSAYTPLSYAAYAQNMFNYGGVGGIPTPLTREILAFVESVDAFGAKMQSVKATAVLRLRHVVQQLWPRAQVKAFGSYVTGLSLPSSDLDLVICLPKVHHVAGPSAPGFLEGRNAIKESWQNILARCLRMEAWVDVSSMKVIGNTAVPVIKLNTVFDANFHVSLDISFGAHGHQGLEASELNVSLIRSYPSLRPIVLVLKQFLTRRGLCEVFTGGMSSYAILLMAARFLQEQPTNVTTDIGASLLGMLDFYGNHLQPSVTGISVANMCYFSRNDSNEVLNAVPYSRSVMHRRHSLRQDTVNLGVPPSLPTDSYRPYKFDPLFIEDPLDKGNNVGRNCFRVQQVQRVFSDAHKALLDAITVLESRGFRDCETFSLLTLLVGDLASLHQ